MKDLNFSLFALVAQWIERWFPKPCVVGSSPTEGIIFILDVVMRIGLLMMARSLRFVH